MIKQLIGKTIEKIETKPIKYYEDYEYLETTAEWIYFTDQSGVVVFATIKYSPSRYWDDEPELNIVPMNEMCMKCGTIRPRDKECPHY